MKTDGIVGGRARIDGTRIRVIDVLQRHELGESIEEIAEAFLLKIPQVLESLKYYYEHPSEIREEIRKEQEFVESVHKIKA